LFNIGFSLHSASFFGFPPRLDVQHAITPVATFVDHREQALAASEPPAGAYFNFSPNTSGGWIQYSLPRAGVSFL
jgi:hypothetical protein